MRKFLVALLMFALFAPTAAAAHPRNGDDWPETPTTLGSYHECWDRGRTLYNVTVFNDADKGQRIFWEFTKNDVTTRKSTWIPRRSGSYVGAYLRDYPITLFRIWVLDKYGNEDMFFYRTLPIQPLTNC